MTDAIFDFDAIRRRRAALFMGSEPTGRMFDERGKLIGPPVADIVSEIARQVLREMIGMTPTRARPANWRVEQNRAAEAGRVGVIQETPALPTASKLLEQIRSGIIAPDKVLEERYPYGQRKTLGDNLQIEVGSHWVCQCGCYSNVTVVKWTMKNGVESVEVSYGGPSNERWGGADFRKTFRPRQ